MFVGFGIPAEWKTFQTAHPVLVEKVPPFFVTCDKMFQRKIAGSSPSADKLVFYLGMLCVEDFREILLLCANGFGVGGQKLLRVYMKRRLQLTISLPILRRVISFSTINWFT